MSLQHNYDLPTTVFLLFVRIIVKYMTEIEVRTRSTTSKMTVKNVYKMTQHRHETASCFITVYKAK